jgi:hypothetical protein
MEALWEAKESIKALQEPAESIASAADGYCGGNRQETVGRYPPSLESDVRPGLV